MTTHLMGESAQVGEVVEIGSNGLLYKYRPNRSKYKILVEVQNSGLGTMGTVHYAFDTTTDLIKWAAARVTDKDDLK